MKRKFFLLIALLLLIIVFGGCDGGGITPGTTQLTTEEKEFISIWGYDSEYTVRWPDGYVDVYDATGYSQMQKVLNQWNEIIDGVVTFRLSNNLNSPVRIYFQSPTECYEEQCVWDVDVIWGDSNYTLSKIDLKIGLNLANDYSVRLHSFRAIVGFNRRIGPSEVCSSEDNISDTMKKMVKALHKVPRGYPLF
jgi:hypothetical protein